MRLETSIKNTISSIVMQFMAMVIGLILPRLYLIAFGSEVNGLVSSITQFILYFTLVEAGLASAATNALYLPLAAKDENRINRILVAAKEFYFKIGYIFSGLVIGLALLYPFFVSTESLSALNISLLVLILGFQGAFDFFTLSKYRALLTADQKYYVIANATTVANLLNFFLVFVSIKLSFGIVVVRAIAVTTYILRSLILNFYVRKHYKYIDYSLKPDNGSLNKRWDAMILQLLGLAQTAMPIVMLTIFTRDLKVVSIYSIYNMVATSVLAILIAITNGFAASFGEIIAKKEEETLKIAYRKYEFMFYFIMSWAYSCMNILYISFVRLYTVNVTDANYILPLVAFLFVVNGLAYNFKTPAGTLIGSAGLYKETKPATIIQTMIAVSLSIILIPSLGIIGVLIAQIASNLYRDIDLIIFMSKFMHKVPYMESFGRIIRCVIIFLITNVPFVIYQIKPHNLVIWAIWTIGVAVWSFLVAAIINFIFDKELFKIISINLAGVITKSRS